MTVTETAFVIGIIIVHRTIGYTVDIEYTNDLLTTVHLTEGDGYLHHWGVSLVRDVM